MARLFEFQELVRILSATLIKYDSQDNMISWQQTLKVIKTLLFDYKLLDLIPKDAQDHFLNEIKKTENKDNVRAEVKSILMYPKTKYSNMEETKIGEAYYSKIQQRFDNIKFKLVLQSSKILLIPDINVNEYIFDYVSHLLQHNVELNKDCHVSVIPSHVVSDIGNGKINKFISQYSPFNVKIGKIMHIFLEDCPIISHCYVLRIISNELQDFINKFNIKFGASINTNFHITFAVKYRDIFHNNNI